MSGSREQGWLKEYFQEFQRAFFNESVFEKLMELKKIFQKTDREEKKVIFIGNGGSAAMASHCAVDMTKNAGIRCINFNEADLITCFSNDFGYERCFEKALEFYADPGDCVVLISCSGRSPNIVNAAQYAKDRGLEIVTFSGFSTDNPLFARGNLNFCVESRAYNIIEMTHHLWLLAVCDLIIGKSEYPASPA